MEETSKLILKELRIATRLLAILAVAGKKQKQQIEVLAEAGLSPKEIAGLLATTPNTVSVTLAKMRRASRNPATSFSNESDEQD